MAEPCVLSKGEKLPIRLLVFGSTGQVGRALQVAASLGDFKVIALTRSQADLTNQQAISAAVAAVQSDVVVNTAAYTAVDRAESDSETAFAVNAEGARHIAEACAANQLPLVHFSTDYVFDGRKLGPYVETDAVNPLGVYGKSKLAGEVAVRDVCPQHIILRTSWVYAAEGQNFVRTMLSLAKERCELKIVNDQYGCPTAAADLARLLLNILPALGNANAAWGTYHATGKGITTWYDFAREIFRLREEITGAKPPVVNPVPTRGYPTPSPRPVNTSLDCTRLREIFGQTLPPWQSSLAPAVSEILAGS